jgi:hypothetical protein
MSDQLWFSIKIRNTVGTVAPPEVLDALELAPLDDAPEPVELLAIEPPVPAPELLEVPVAPPGPSAFDPPHADGSVAAATSAAPKDAKKVVSRVVFIGATLPQRPAGT